MNYSDALQKAKSERKDHRKAKSVPTSVERRKRVRDSKDFITVEREHDPLRRFGGSVKSVYYDSDGDGYKDSYGRAYRSGVLKKPGVLVPSFGPTNPPVSGPNNLNAESVILAPASGPSSLDATIIVPNAGPSNLNTDVLVPASGPSNLDASINAPASGPSTLDASIAVPASGPSNLDASTAAPASGPSNLDAFINAPASGPSTLDASIAVPASGPSNLVAGTAAPASGPSNLDAFINAPASGPSGLSTEIATLNIAPTHSDQSFADNSSSGTAGEIRYSSDVEYLFIHNGSVWHRTNGG